MYSLKTKTVGNPDKGQDPSRPLFWAEVTTLSAPTLEDLRSLVSEWMAENDIGSGNWASPPVLRDGKRVGFMSYNGRVWVEKNWTPETQEYAEAI